MGRDQQAADAVDTTASMAEAASGFDDRESLAALLLRLRESGMRDLAVLRAIEAVPRAAFVRPADASLANRAIMLPIGCGQVVPDPLFVARLAAGARLDAAMRVLLVGLGSGYTAAVLSHLVAEVVAIDRFRSLVTTAGARLAGLGITTVAGRCADALALPEQQPFDRVVIMAAVAPVPPSLWRLVKPGGALIHARPGPAEAGQMLVMVERPEDGISKQTLIGPSRLAALRPGLAAHL